jgi:hypothetical protein
MGLLLSEEQAHVFTLRQASQIVYRLDRAIFSLRSA